MKSQEGQPVQPGYVRWTCVNHNTPVLLAMVDDEGHLQIKVRNRVWVVSDCTAVTATCPKCGQEHTLRFSKD